ncbi:MAG: class II aldolase/adducin family protein, partial [Bacteroidota bacterium]
MKQSLNHPSDSIIRFIDKIYNSRMTTTSGGNISIKEDSGTIWVTPSAIDKGSLRRSDIISLDPDGNIHGPHKPSSELPFHKAIYENRPDIKAVIHAHPPGLVSFSVVRQIPNTNVIPQAKHVCGAIGYAKYALPGSEELGNKIAEEFAAGKNAVIMENHGVVVGGTDIKEAFNRFETLEFTAKTLIAAASVGKANILNNEQIERFQKINPADIPAFEDASYPSDELEIRTKITRLIKRACRQQLMIGSHGTVSARWRGNDFLITPADKYRWDIENEDIVQIRGGKREKGKIPSRSTILHQKIYEKYPDVNSIIITQTPYTMAFSITNEAMDVRTIPESWIFLQNIAQVPFGEHYANLKAVAEVIGPSYKGSVL